MEYPTCQLYFPGIHAREITACVDREIDSWDIPYNSRKRCMKVMNLSLRNLQVGELIAYNEKLSLQSFRIQSKGTTSGELVTRNHLRAIRNTFKS